MEFLQIISAEDYRTEKIFKSYCSSFPEDERREWFQFVKLFEHPNVKVISVLNQSENVGYLIVWELSSFLFVEHFEVLAEYRNQNLGSKITDWLFKNFPRIILEIEPETLNEYAKRRFLFYQRNGFSLIDELYVQPSYGEGKNSLNLWLLANYTPENLSQVKDEIYDIVYH